MVFDTLPPLFTSMTSRQTTTPSIHRSSIKTPFCQPQSQTAKKHILDSFPSTPYASVQFLDRNLSDRPRSNSARCHRFIHIDPPSSPSTFPSPGARHKANLARGKPPYFEVLTDAPFPSHIPLSHERRSSWIEPQGLRWVQGVCY